MKVWKASFFLPLILLFLSSLFSKQLFSITFHVGTHSGVMTQPSSNYYHAVYGGYFDLGTDDRRFFSRVSYVERPKFTAAGYIDQDYAESFIIGTKVTKAKTHGLLAGIGGGLVGGYIKPDPDYPEANGEKRSYRLPGISTMIEYSLEWKHIDLGIGHQTFIGHADSEQLRAYVAWPYNFILIRLGAYW